MAKLRPWFDVVKPREDLREGKPLDASEFAVHLDHVRENRAPADYQQPERFFERTYLTHTLRDLAAEVVRRTCSERDEASLFRPQTELVGASAIPAILARPSVRSPGARRRE